MKNIKHWLQVVGVVLMVGAIRGDYREGLYHEWFPKMFTAGALIFLSSFLTWKPKKNDDDDD